MAHTHLTAAVLSVHSVEGVVVTRAGGIEAVGDVVGSLLDSHGTDERDEEGGGEEVEELHGEDWIGLD